MKIELEIIERGGLPIIVFPSQEEIEYIIEKAPEEEKAKVADAIAKVNSLRESPKFTVISKTYDFETYTYGAELEAQRKATSWEGKEQHFDQSVYFSHLLASSLKMTLAEVHALPLPIATALIKRMQDLNSVDLEKLSFLDSKLTSTKEASSPQEAQ